MALFLSRFLAASVLLLSVGLVANAATVTYDFNITWVHENPDGQLVRPVIGINDQWPLPTIVVTKGDRLVVNVNNQLGNQTTSLHFHGLYMNGSTHMDGPSSVTQCDIPIGGSFVYDFMVDQAGTYWYHSHTKGQYPDGLRGPLIIHDPDSPLQGDYDEEIVLTFSDWYHEQMPVLISRDFLTYSNPGGAEPVPQAALMNDMQNLTVPVEPGKTYLFRMVNMGAFAAQYVWFEDHTMRIVEVDGIYTEPAEADMLYMTAAQRYSVLVTAKNDSSANFAIHGSMDEDLFDEVPEGLNPNVTGWLVYDDSKARPAPATVEEFDPFDDFTLVPRDGEALYESVDHTLTLDLKMDNLIDGVNYAFFNNVTYVHPKVPTLYTALSSGGLATNAEIYGKNTNAFVLNRGDIIELVVNNNDPGKHPFHLHGHAFQLAHRSDDDAGPYAGGVDMPSAPMRRDTVLVHPGGNIVLRFKADNPGIWLFHCHIEWHVLSGLVATLIEDPLTLQRTLPSQIPQSHWDACKAQDIPTSGNAAGNTADLLDLSGAHTSPGPIPSGFTAKGIVALVFSCVSAFLGMAVISWYGMKPIGK